MFEWKTVHFERVYTWRFTFLNLKWAAHLQESQWCVPGLCHRCIRVSHFRHAGIYGHAKPRHWLRRAQEERESCWCCLQASTTTDLSTPTSPAVSPNAPSTSKLPSSTAAEGAFISWVLEGEKQFAACGEQYQQEEGKKRGCVVLGQIIYSCLLKYLILHKMPSSLFVDIRQANLSLMPNLFMGWWMATGIILYSWLCTAIVLI